MRVRPFLSSLQEPRLQPGLGIECAKLTAACLSRGRVQFDIDFTHGDGLLAGLHQRAGSGCAAGRFGLADDLPELLNVRVVVGQTANEAAFAVTHAGARVGLDLVLIVG